MQKVVGEFYKVGFGTGRFSGADFFLVHRRIRLQFFFLRGSDPDLFQPDLSLWFLINSYGRKDKLVIIIKCFPGSGSRRNNLIMLFL